MRIFAAWAGLATAGALALSACTTAGGGGDADDGSASGAGGSAAGTPATGGVAPQGGTSGSATTGGVAGSVITGGVGPQQGGASGTAPTGGVTNGGASGVSGAAGANGATAGVMGGNGGAAGAGGTSGSGGKGGGGGGTGGRPNATGANGALKIMPLGDSITASFCWRPKLWQKLRQAGKANFDFVGSQTSSDCGVAGYDANNEGHGGYLVTNIAGSMIAELRGWIQTNTPDLVLMHLATNDCWNSVAPATILNAYGTVVDELRARNPNVWVLVAQIIPMNPVNTASCSTCACSACGGRVQTLNGMIPAWASTKSTAASPVLAVDQWTGYDANADSNGDGVHPGDSGSEKIATRWFNALSPLF